MISLLCEAALDRKLTHFVRQIHICCVEKKYKESFSFLDFTYQDHENVPFFFSLIDFLKSQFLLKNIFFLHWLPLILF